MIELLVRLHNEGLTVTTDGEHLIIAPADRLSDDLRDKAKAFKSDLIRELMEDKPPPLTERQLSKLNSWLDATGETVEADRQLVIDECQLCKKKRAAYVETFKLLDRLKSEVSR